LDEIKNYLGDIHKKKIISFIKKSPTRIGLAIFGLLILGAIYTIGKTIYNSEKLPIVLLLCCIFIAISFKDASFFPAIAIMLFCLFCAVCIISSHSKQEAYLESLFLKGEKNRRSIYIEESHDDGNIYPAHYETQYYFSVDNSESLSHIKLVKIVLFIFSYGCPISVFLILRKSLKKGV